MEDCAHTVISIDGPAASGKSSVARELAGRFGFVYVNSGAIYRAVTWNVLEHGINPRDQPAVERHVTEVRIVCDVQDGASRVVIAGVDPKEHLHSDAVNRYVSAVSRLPRVREILVEKMRGYACDHDLVMEGRDIGSVVFPNTPFKFYIDASPDIRLQRRAAQGQRDEIAVRDRQDSSRTASPLVIPRDAEVIDTSEMSIEQVVDEIVVRLRRKHFNFGSTASVSLD